ncbi:unnamed protein product, partial [Prorocentrum cordatum]
RLDAEVLGAPRRAGPPRRRRRHARALARLRPHGRPRSPRPLSASSDLWLGCRPSAACAGQLDRRPSSRRRGRRAARQV